MGLPWEDSKPARSRLVGGSGGLVGALWLVCLSNGQGLGWCCLPRFPEGRGLVRYPDAKCP